MWSAAPVAVCRERGVDLGPYQKAELAEYMDAGPREGKTARLVRARILGRRGGVLPHNWTAVEHYKANVDLMAQIRAEGKFVRAAPMAHHVHMDMMARMRAEGKLASFD
tara:strand:- start:1818 stop:2144 length:327 start_codon:yes stop_codon:yes gene_type:complete